MDKNVRRDRQHAIHRRSKDLHCLLLDGSLHADLNQMHLFRVSIQARSRSVAIQWAQFPLTRHSRYADAITNSQGIGMLQT
jgi:hypothetical protein